MNAAAHAHCAFTGRVVREFVELLGVTDDGYVIGRVTRIIDLGRPDRGRPVDPDALLADEAWNGGPQVGNANVERDRRYKQRQDDMRARVESVLREHGPLTTPELAERLDATVTAVTYHMKQWLGMVYSRGLHSQGKARFAVWGLIEGGEG